jgi:hypothetical protein
MLGWRRVRRRPHNCPTPVVADVLGQTDPEEALGWSWACRLAESSLAYIPQPMRDWGPAGRRRGSRRRYVAAAADRAVPLVEPFWDAAAQGADHCGGEARTCGAA